MMCCAPVSRRDVRAAAAISSSEGYQLLFG
jgi:hypothetical protein